MSDPQVLELVEERRSEFSPDELSYELGDTLWKHYGKYVSVDFPSPKTGGRWVLTPRGYVGYIPLSEELALSLQPKVGLESVFRMLEYAYRLDARFLEGLFDSKDLREFYERLAGLLADRVSEQARRGLYKDYLKRRERLPYMRGSLDTRELALRPWEASLPCAFQEHTTDIEDNRILLWTLRTIAKSRFCGPSTLARIGRAYRVLQGHVRLVPALAKDCTDRSYNRLNAEYKVLHALCRFFLENAGPTQEIGDRNMLPFLLHMPTLYEDFVAQWIAKHCPGTVRVRAQELLPIDPLHGLRFKIDLVFYDVYSGATLSVLDTKYKASFKPAAEDIAQAVAYAEAKGCTEALLAYPIELQEPLSAVVGDVHVRTVSLCPDAMVADPLEALSRLALHDGDLYEAVG